MLERVDDSRVHVLLHPCRSSCHAITSGVCIVGSFLTCKVLYTALLSYEAELACAAEVRSSGGEVLTSRDQSPILNGGQGAANSEPAAVVPGRIEAGQSTVCTSVVEMFMYLFQLTLQILRFG